MRNALVAVIILIFASLGCSLSRFVTTNDNKTATPTPTVSSPAPSPSQAATPDKPALVDTLKKWKGKYPYEVKFIENADVRARLSSLLGRDFADLKKNFNVETPIEIRSGILKAQACQAHNCGANNYYIFVDLVRDNFNVYHIEDSGVKTYFEKGKIKLPEDFEASLSE